MKRLFFFTLGLILMVFGVSGQTSLEYYTPDSILTVTRFSDVEDLDEVENFRESIGLYEQEIKNTPNDAQLNHTLGFCYLNSNSDTKKAIEYFENALKNMGKLAKNSKLWIDTYFFLGKAYRINYQFDKSITTLNYIKQRVTNVAYLEKIEKELTMSINGLELSKKPVDITVYNLQSIVNSTYSDHSPVVSADESVLFFTTRRRTETSPEEIAYGEYNEDILVSSNKYGTWTAPNMVSKKINTAGNESVCHISADGQKIIIFKNGDLFYSELKGNEWTTPKAFPAPINSPANETHGSMTPDGKTIYFTSNRKGTLGGLDIFVSNQKPDKTWSTPVNLGTNVNTPVNEETPNIHADGITLYYSSEGHNTMGGFDIFVTKKLNGYWQNSLNMGYPLNTTQNDLFFMPSSDEKRGYYSSTQNGTIGRSDIFMVYFNQKTQNDLSVVTGFIFNTDSTIPQGVAITITDIESQDVITKYNPNNVTGKFVFVLSLDKDYNFCYEAPGYLPQLENISILAVNRIPKHERSIVLNKIEVGKTSEKYKLDFYNAGNDININKSSGLILTRIAEFLQKNPTYVLDITSPHRMNDATLPERRAESVKTFLTKKSINEQRIYRNLSEQNIVGDTLLLTIYDEVTIKNALESSKLRNDTRQVQITKESQMFHIPMYANGDITKDSEKLLDEIVDLHKKHGRLYIDLSVSKSLKENLAPEDKLMMVLQYFIDNGVAKKSLTTYMCDEDIDGDTMRITIVDAQGMKQLEADKQNRLAYQDSMMMASNETEPSKDDNKLNKTGDFLNKIAKSMSGSVVQAVKSNSENQTVVFDTMQTVKKEMVTIKEETNTSTSKTVIENTVKDSENEVKTEVTDITNNTVLNNTVVNSENTATSPNESEAVVEVDNILFDMNSFKVTTSKNLDALAKYLMKNPESMIEIGGFADASGNNSYNRMLSQKRAEYVKTYLVRKGVNTNQFITINYGTENPIALNKNDKGGYNKEGLKYNRRVEFKVLKPGKTKLVIRPIKVPENLKVATSKNNNTTNLLATKSDVEKVVADSTIKKEIKKETKEIVVDKKSVVQNKTTNTKTVSETTMDKDVYAILLISSDSQLEKSYFEEYSKQVIENKLQDGSFNYILGDFVGMENAQKEREKVTKKFTNARIFLKKRADQQ